MCTLLLKYFCLFNAWKGKISDIFFKTAFGKSNSQNCTSSWPSSQKVCCPLSQRLFAGREFIKIHHFAHAHKATCFIQRMLRVSFSFLITGLMFVNHSFGWLLYQCFLLKQNPLCRFWCSYLAIPTVWSQHVSQHVSVDGVMLPMCTAFYTLYGTSAELHPSFIKR